MKKRVLCLILAVVMICSLLPTMALAVDETPQVRVIVENTTFPVSDGASWDGTLVDTWVEIGDDSTMMSCVVDALTEEGYSQTGAENNYIYEINYLLAFEGGQNSGWMMTLNDWFINEGADAFTVSNKKLKEGDEIRVLYTCELGEDLGGSWNSTDKRVKAIAVSGGSISPSFSPDTHAYTLTLDEAVSAVTVTPTASNKNYQVRTSVNGKEYQRTAAIPVSDGTVITVTCGDPSWPSMNDNDGDAQTYTLTVSGGAPEAEVKGYLSDLYFSEQQIKAKASKAKLAMTPDFDQNTFEYTVTVPMAQSKLYYYPTLSTEGSGKTITAVYTNISGEEKSVKPASAAAGGNLANCVAANSDVGNDVRVVIDDQTYLIHLVRPIALSGLSIDAGAFDVTMSPKAFKPETLAYAATIPADVKPVLALNGTASNHLRYSTDGGNTWTDLPSGGGQTAAIPTNVETILCQITDKTGDWTKAVTYSVTLERMTASLADATLLGAECAAGFYPTFSNDNKDYYLVWKQSMDKAVTFTIPENASVSFDGVTEVPAGGVLTVDFDVSKESQTLVLTADGLSMTYTFHHIVVGENAPDAVVDYLVINSQYTNNVNNSYGNFGLNPEMTLAATDGSSAIGTSVKSLGNFGGYITYYYENPIQDDPRNKYGMDFYVYGNANKDTSTGKGNGFFEPGQVWVSEDGKDWYALAGSAHYEPNVDWNYTVTYKKTADGKTAWTDNHGNDQSQAAGVGAWPLASNYYMNDLSKGDTIVLSGICLPTEKGDLVSKTDFPCVASWGYVDMLPNGTIGADANPYVDNSGFTSQANGFDLKWAVDADGLPVTVNNVHYIKVVTATNIWIGGVNEKSTEVQQVLRTVPQSASVGTTALPSGITVSDGTDSVTVELEEGKNVYDVYCGDMTAVSVKVETAAPDDRVFINNRFASAGTTDEVFAISDTARLVRVIVQNGDSEPSIVLLKLQKDMPVEWAGSGTQADPYQLATTAQLGLLSERSAEENFANTYFKFVNDITLPENWTPIGTQAIRFSGNIDGDGHLLTVPAGEKALLGATENATLKNLNIYGESINGNGVVSIYTTGSTKPCITIENVTLKSGTKTSGSGFISGYASGSHPVTIRNCTVEEGVTIGDGTANNIGSFGGDFNGTVIGCVSHAIVKGVNYVGGICGSKGQTMGDYVIIDCIFDGTVEASGNYVGGISGGGYGGTSFGLASAPNTPCVTILNCLCSGSITGSDKVGGILGAEPGVKECWNNGVGYIQSNLFTGTVTATGESASVGGIVGYLSSLNNAMVISDNYYLDTAASKGIGMIEMVETPESSGNFGTGFNKYTLSGAKYGRTDDPVGTDADKLTKAVTSAELTGGSVLEKLNAGMNSSGNWTQGAEYPEFNACGEKHLVRIVCTALNSLNGVSQLLGEDVLEGKTLTLQYSDGSIDTLSATDESVKKGYAPTKDDFGKYLPATITVQGHQLEFNLQIKAPAPSIQNSAADTVTAYVGQPLTVDLKSIFEDVNDLDLTYTAKLPGAKKYDDIETTAGVYTYPQELSEAGELKFSFKAANVSSSSNAFTLTVHVYDPAADAVVYLTVSNKGVLATAKDGAVMADQPVTVKDINSDGELTFDEALVAAHAAYNSAEGYTATAGDYGLSVEKLWGENTFNTLFFINNEGLASGVGTDTVTAGDHLVASVNADDVYYADWYSFFNKCTDTVTAGDNITLTLKGHLGMAWTDEDKANVGLAGITVKTADGTVLGTTDENGSVTFSFANAGTYIVTASGTVTDQVDDYSTYPDPHYVDVDCPIIAPACVVTVSERQAGPVSSNIKVYFTLLGDTKHDTPTEETGTHTLKSGNLTTWLTKKSYSIEENSTVWDLMELVASQTSGLSFANASGNYVSAITYNNVTLGEFDNGNLSGWMYTLNGTHPDLGVSEQYLSDGDSIVFHYTDDYTKEQGSEEWNTPTDKKEDEKQTGNQTEKSSGKFVDVPENSYYTDAVDWAVENDITVGVDDTHFAPNTPCDRAQTVTFLWRAAGCPEPTGTVNPFTDVDETAYYYKAVLWAVENGITKGTSNTTFSPTATVNRAQVVTFLCRMAQGSSDGENPFTDVKDGEYYAEAVNWAVANEVTKGTSSTTFSPDADCVRAQIVTFLYRYFA